MTSYKIDRNGEIPIDYKLRTLGMLSPHEAKKWKKANPRVTGEKPSSFSNSDLRLIKIRARRRAATAALGLATGGLIAYGLFTGFANVGKILNESTAWEPLVPVIAPITNKVANVATTFVHKVGDIIPPLNINNIVNNVRNVAWNVSTHENILYHSAADFFTNAASTINIDKHALFGLSGLALSGGSIALFLNKFGKLKDGLKVKHMANMTIKSRK